MIRHELVFALLLRVMDVGALIDPGEEPAKIVDALEKCAVMISFYAPVF